MTQVENARPTKAEEELDAEGSIRPNQYLPTETRIIVPEVDLEDARSGIKYYKAK